MNGSCRKNVNITGKKSLLTRELVNIISTREKKNKKEGEIIIQDAPEQIEKPKSLYTHAHKGPLEEHEQDTTEETCRPAQFLLSCEEIKRLLRTDDECQPRHEEDLRIKKKGVGSC